MEILNEKNRGKIGGSLRSSLKSLWSQFIREKVVIDYGQFVSLLQVVYLQDRTKSSFNIESLEPCYRFGLRALGKLEQQDRKTLSEVIAVSANDLIGAINETYEFAVLSQSQKKKLGIFYTPLAYCADTLSEMKSVLKSRSVIDPFMGVGNWLVAAALTLKKSESELFGFDIDRDAVLVARLNLSIALGTSPKGFLKIQENLCVANTLWPDEKDKEKLLRVSKSKPNVVTNPPYGFAIPEESRHLFELGCAVPDREVFYFAIAQSLHWFRESQIQTHLVPNTMLVNLGASTFVDQLLSKNHLFQKDLSNISIFESANVRNIQLVVTRNDDFTLPSYKRIQARKGQKSNIATGLKVSDLFEVSQGLIPYDKYRGHTQHQIENRVFHSSQKEGSAFRKELKGKDVTLCRVQWSGGNWIKYGKWLAAPRNQKFFIEPRVLVREITGAKEGRLFCGYTDEELYNTPSIINVVLKPDSKMGQRHLKTLAILLSSREYAEYHMKCHPKANKGLFPKILVNDVRTLPLPENFMQLDYSKLYDSLSHLANKGMDRDALFEVLDKELGKVAILGTAA